VWVSRIATGKPQFHTGDVPAINRVVGSVPLFLSFNVPFYFQVCSHYR